MWSKLIKRSCYVNYNLHFVTGVDFGEDALIWVQLLQHSEIKIAYLHKALYHYFISNPNSITQSNEKAIIETRKRYYHSLKELLPPEDKWIVKREWIIFHYDLWCRHLITSSEFRKQGYKDKDIKEFFPNKQSKYSLLLINHGFGWIVRIIRMLMQK